MIQPNLFYKELLNNDIGFFTGVPDSLLKDICAYISDNSKKNDHIIASNEGGAIGLAVGNYLSTGKVPFVYMQNSGIGNAVNPILSIANDMVYGIPMIIMIGWRGEPNIKDEPQHLKQGLVSEELLKALDIPYYIMDNESNYQDIIKKLKQKSLLESKPVALLVKKNTFSSYKQLSKKVMNFEMSREDAIKKIIDVIGDDIIVSTTGKTSREVFEYREEKGQSHEKDFLIVGGMGHTSQIALGVALGTKTKKVYCLDGDGSVIMHMGSLAILGERKGVTLKHIILNNLAHDSVGGQPTASKSMNFCRIAKHCGYSLTLHAETIDELERKLIELKNHNGIALLEIKVNIGARKDLGRPTKTPKENKSAFINYVRG